ncbi:MAG: hypothetical protein ACRDF4_04275 [Rhabdochlamydiaceae bacterium]
MANSSLSIEEVALQLGVPSSALRLYLSLHSQKDPQSVSISDAQIEELKQDLSRRQGSLRLDDLARTTLTIEWLAEAAVGSTHRFQDTVQRIESLENALVDKADNNGLSGELESVSEKVLKLEHTVEKLAQGDGAKALSHVAQVQQMVEQQGKEVDRFRVEFAEIKNQLNQLTAELASLARSQADLISGLKIAVGMQEVSDKEGASKKAPVTDSNSSGNRVTFTHSEDVEPAAAHSSEPETSPDPKRFENQIPDKAAKFGVKREIEYNFLYERMGFQRPDQYAEGWTGEIPGPSDEEIRDFLAKFELSCPGEEVDIVIVHRGDYQMVQYQRVEAQSGRKNWIPSKKR